MPDEKSWRLNRPVGWLVMAAFLCLSLVPAQGRAALIQSRLADGSSLAERSAQIETIRQALEREVVVQRLADYGLTPQEVSAKLDTFSDEQLHQLAGLSDDLAAGGILGAVIAVLVIVLLVIVIIKVSDKQIIIK